MAHHQLEGDPAQVDLRERALLASLHGAVVDEDHAAILKDPDGGAHVGRAQADAQQALVPLDVLRARRRLDELQIELAARAFQQSALGQDAEELSFREHRKAEQLLVELDPVGGAIAAGRRGQSPWFAAATRAPGAASWRTR